MYVQRKTINWMFIAVLFIIVYTWKQPRCLSAGEWMCLLYISIVIYFVYIYHNPASGILLKLKRNELSSHESTWIKHR